MKVLVIDDERTFTIEGLQYTVDQYDLTGPEVCYARNSHDELAELLRHSVISQVGK